MQQTRDDLTGGLPSQVRHQLIQEEEAKQSKNIIDDDTGIDFMGGLVPAPLALPEETKQFRPYDTTVVTSNGQEQPRLIPLDQRNSASFKSSESERSQDIDAFLASNQEASQGQGRQMKLSYLEEMKQKPRRNATQIV